MGTVISAVIPHLAFAYWKAIAVVERHLVCKKGNLPLAPVARERLTGGIGAYRAAPTTFCSILLALYRRDISSTKRERMILRAYGD